MLVVAGLTLKNLEPRVWDPDSRFYLPSLRAIMVSYAEFHGNSTRHRRAQSLGLRRFLAVPHDTRIYLDNGAFYFLRTGLKADFAAYRQFVRRARPDWYPVPFDAIPTPRMSHRQQRECFSLTMRINRAHHHDGYVPVVHVGSQLPHYVEALRRSVALEKKHTVALGGIVPNLLRSPRAWSYERVLDCLLNARRAFAGKRLHVFGLGGTATIHLAGLLGLSSADSCGWRNRAARGIIQLPGHGDRMVAELGSWSGREPSQNEWQILRRCECPACTAEGLRGIRAAGLRGFCNRATHNLFVLLEEATWVERQLVSGTYEHLYKTRLTNSIYRPIIERLVERSTSRDRVA